MQPVIVLVTRVLFFTTYLAAFFTASRFFAFLTTQLSSFQTIGTRTYVPSST
jgi:hypothetical protein